MSAPRSPRWTILVGLAACCGAIAPGRPAAAQWAQPAGLQVTLRPTAVTVRAGDRVILEYCPAASPYKPYVKRLFTPGGVQILRDSPADHKHHHGLMFAIAAEGVNFWEEVDRSGRQSPPAGAEMPWTYTRGDPEAGFGQQLDWLAPGGEKLLAELRAIKVHAGADIPATLLTWSSRLETAAGKKSVKLTGAPYFGLGMRFVESMDKAGRFFNSQGTQGPTIGGNDQRVTPAKWCAYVSQVDGKPVTVAIFDYPSNSHPAYFFTMRPFAYLCATINLAKQPLELKSAAPLELRYGVALWDGETDRAGVEKLYRKWIELQRPDRPRTTPRTVGPAKP